MADSPKAPTNAPAQVRPTTGKGQVGKTEATFQAPPAAAPKPPSAASTNYVKAGPSVDYNTQQGSRVPADIQAPHDSATGNYANQAILDQQAQQMQDKGGA